MPKITVTGPDGNILGEIQQNRGETFADAIRRERVLIDLPCGGKQTCGKCRCRVTEGEAPLADRERLLLTAEERDAGERLLCCLTFQTDGALRLAESAGKIESIRVLEGETGGMAISAGARYDAAADIGTTTIALALFENRSQRAAASVSRNNRQRSYGADVISRIEAAEHGAAEQLKQLVWQDITDGLDELLEAVGGGTIDRLALSANTTMEHLIAGDSCAGLGKYPFHPVSLELRTRRAREWHENVRGRYEDVEVTLLPGISAFVGADILSGMYECGLDQKEGPLLFLDLGTNGEMVLKTKSGFLAASTAAGPALEGACISCGVPGVEGAVCGISIIGNRCVVQTIGKKPPIGLCGTGVLELAYELRKTGAVDETGTFLPEYQGQGFRFATRADGRELYFTQRDMRRLQMAKAAIRSGIELLLEEAGIGHKELKEVFLAGGFGYALNARKAAGIGLLPPGLRDRTAAVGNTSLLGAMRFLRERDGAEKLLKMRDRTREISLASHPLFESCYYRYLNFGETADGGV